MTVDTFRYRISEEVRACWVEYQRLKAMSGRGDEVNVYHPDYNVPLHYPNRDRMHNPWFPDQHNVTNYTHWVNTLKPGELDERMKQCRTSYSETQET